ncbi:MAG: hypothetical protein AAF604_17970 [Acidobacteriota bacterium]
MAPPPAPRRWLFPALLTAVLALWLFPGPYFSQAVGLDGSYAWGINAFEAHGAAWGADGAFTFGPLGYLLLPLDGDGHRGRALIFWLFAHGLFVAAFARQAWRHSDRATAFAVLMVAAEVLGLAFGYRLLALVILLLAAERRDRLPFATTWAALLVAALLLARFHLGIAAGACLLVHLLSEKRLSAWIEATVVAIAAGASAFVVCFQGSGQSVLTWLTAQGQLATGFGAAMSLPNPDRAVLAAGLVALVGGSVAAAAALRAGQGRLWWLGAVPLLLAFKHGFVRQDGHVQIFFAFLVAFAGLAMLFSEGRSAAALAALALLVALPGAPAAANHQTVLGIEGWRHLRALWTPSETAAALDRQSRRALDKRRLPGSFVADLRGVPSVDVVPWELTYLAANDLPWQPHPTLQLYTAYTEDLDQQVAAHFAADDAPERLLVHFESLGQRHLLWDTPRTWRQLLARYRPQRFDGRRQLALLTRRDGTAPLARPLAEQKLTGDQWVAPPGGQAGRPLWAEIDLRPTLLDRLAQTLWRTPPVFLEIDLGGERVHRHRLLPATAEGGLLVPPPTTFEAFRAVLRGRAVGQPRRVRLTGPGLSYFRQPVTVRWATDNY